MGTSPRDGDVDYHPAIVYKINVDKRYVKVIDVSENNQKKKYQDFLTESELIKKGFTRKTIKEEKKRYKKTIDSVFSPKDVII